MEQRVSESKVFGGVRLIRRREGGIESDDGEIAGTQSLELYIGLFGLGVAGEETEEARGGLREVEFGVEVLLAHQGGLMVPGLFVGGVEDRPGLRVEHVQLGQLGTATVRQLRLVVVSIGWQLQVTLRVGPARKELTSRGVAQVFLLLQLLLGDDFVVLGLGLGHCLTELRSHEHRLRWQSSLLSTLLLTRRGNPGFSRILRGVRITGHSVLRLPNPLDLLRVLLGPVENLVVGDLIKLQVLHVVQIVLFLVIYHRTLLGHWYSDLIVHRLWVLPPLL
jgi:hypothetical protein